MGKDAKVIDWLLEGEQPSVRYRTLRDLLGRSESDPEVVAARRAIPERGWAAEMLREQDPAGWWAAPESLYVPKYLSTTWRLLVLADLGLTREDPAIARSCERWMEGSGKADGGFGPDSSKTGHECTTGNTTRALIDLGYLDHPRVRRAMDWMVRRASPLGGWSCFGSGRNLDTWEPLSAFTRYPRSRWTPAMQEAVARGAEFFLERELHRQGERYVPWFRFHYPVHYYYDLLVGLDVLTRLGHGADPRLGTALEHLRKSRRADGRWNLDAVHPDVEGAMAAWYRRHPKRAPTPLLLETPGAPSKMITLRALTVLERVRGAT